MFTCFNIFSGGLFGINSLSQGCSDYFPFTTPRVSVLLENNHFRDKYVEIVTHNIESGSTSPPIHYISNSNSRSFTQYVY